MHHRKISAFNAIAFFLFWLLVLLAGADFPPPTGFLWIVLVIALCAFVVYWRIPTYIDWYRTQRSGRRWRVLLDGIVAGLVVSITFALNGSGESSITMQPADYAIWFAVLSVIGAINSVALYTINALLISRMDNA
jgi:hypothetical protein